MERQREDIESGDFVQADIKEPQTIQEIILRQIRKIGDLMSDELLNGRDVLKPIHTTGGLTYIKEYKTSTKKAYCNSVDFIVDVVYPHSDTAFKEKINEIDAKDFKDIDDELKEKKILFREINKMFERVDFFKGKGEYNE